VTNPPADERAVADAPINLRRLGRVRVLEALARSRRLSRADLVEQTGLARASVGSVVFDLMREGLVEETPDEASPAIRTGRPPQLVSLVPRAAYARAGIAASACSSTAILSGCWARRPN